jgi:hypothetical protein
MKIPANVLNFATEKNSGVYTQFVDYYNQYRSMNGAKNVSFSTVDDTGKSISFDEKEHLMDVNLRKEIIRVSGFQNVADFTPEQWVTHPNVGWATFAVISGMIDMILPQTIIDSIGIYSDVRAIGWGDTASFDVEPRDLFVVSRAGRRQKSTEIHKQFRGTVVVNCDMHELTVAVSLMRVMAGQESLANFVSKVVRSMETAVTLDVYNLFATTMAALSSTTTTGLNVSGYSQDSLVRLCEQVQSWSGAQPIIVGTQRALVNVLPDDTNYRYTLDSEYVKLGYIKTAFGYDVMRLPQVANITTPWGVKIANDRLFILAPSSQKIVKLVLEGSTLSNTDSVYENSNLLQKSTLFKSWGVGVATNVTAGIITL